MRAYWFYIQSSSASPRESDSRIDWVQLTQQSVRLKLDVDAKNNSLKISTRAGEEVALIRSEFEIAVENSVAKMHEVVLQLTEHSCCSVFSWSMMLIKLYVPSGSRGGDDAETQI